MRIATVVMLLVAAALAVNLESSTSMDTHESAMMKHMSRMGLRNIQENVDKDIWEARQAQQAADDEDAEIARLLAELEGLDADKQVAEKEAKQKQVETKEAEAAHLKEVAKSKFDRAKVAIENKAKMVQETALNSQNDAQAAIEKAEKLRNEANAAMEKAKLLFEQYQDALSADMPEKAKNLEAEYETAQQQADELAKQAGAASEASKASLVIAARYKESATQIVIIEKETRSELMENGLQWVSGPIYDKMKRLCDLDYPTFRKEYRKIRQSPTYKAYRWDIKKACPKAHADDGLESDEDPAAALHAAQMAALKNVHAPPPDASKPYPHSNTHWSIPPGGTVNKWCTTQYGAVPCTMLKRAQRAGLLGDIKIDKKTEKKLSLIQLGRGEVDSFEDIN